MTEQIESVDFDKATGAIIFAPGGIEIILPVLEPDALLPAYAALLMGVAAKLNEKEFVDAIIQDFNDKIDAYKAKQEANG
jgi:hypothetical protein